MTCNRHHNACLCRETKIRKLIKEVMESHADPESNEYNRCDTDPCQWCRDAKELVK